LLQAIGLHSLIPRDRDGHGPIREKTSATFRARLAQILVKREVPARGLVVAPYRRLLVAARHFDDNGASSRVHPWPGAKVWEID
jgi:hypothetical protein